MIWYASKHGYRVCDLTWLALPELVALAGHENARADEHADDGVDSDAVFTI